MNPVRMAIVLVGVLGVLVALAWLGFALWPKAASSEAFQPSPVPTFTPRVTARAISAVASLAPTTLPKPVVTAIPTAFGVVTSRTLNLRAEPNLQASLVGTFKFGDIVPLVRRDSSWYQTSEGGWLSALFLEVRQTRAEAESYARELTG